MPLKFARVNESQVPKEGLCLSSFLVVRRGEGILLGKVRDPDRWGEEWALPTWAPERWRDKWLLPAAHLRWGEHPDDAAVRILRGLVGQGQGTPKYLQVQSQLGSSGHWDVCYVYGVRAQGELKSAWMDPAKFFNIEEVLKIDLGRGHGDVLRDLGPLLRAPL